MKNVIALILAGGMLSVSLHAAGDTKAGKVVYDAKCKTCHGADGAGNAVLAKPLKITIPDIRTPEVQKVTDDEIKKGIQVGKGDMKPVKGLSDKQIEDVIAFSRTLLKP